VKPTEYEWSCGIKVFFDFPKSAPGGLKLSQKNRVRLEVRWLITWIRLGHHWSPWGPWSPMQLIRQLTPHSKDYFRSLGNFAHHGNWEVWYMGSVWNFYFREPQKLEASKFSGESSFSHIFPTGTMGFSMYRPHPPLASMAAPVSTAPGPFPPGGSPWLMWLKPCH